MQLTVSPAGRGSPGPRRGVASPPRGAAARGRARPVLALLAVVLFVLAWRSLPAKRPPPASSSALAAARLSRSTPLGARLLPDPGVLAAGRPPPTAGGAGLADALDWRGVADAPPPVAGGRRCPAQGCPASFGVPTMEDGGGACPVDGAPRLTVDDAAGGARPYLFGGRAPGCRICARAGDAWAAF